LRKAIRARARRKGTQFTKIRAVRSRDRAAKGAPSQLRRGIYFVAARVTGLQGVPIWVASTETIKKGTDLMVPLTPAASNVAAFRPGGVDLKKAKIGVATEGFVIARQCVVGG